MLLYVCHITYYGKTYTYTIIYICYIYSSHWSIVPRTKHRELLADSPARFPKGWTRPQNIALGWKTANPT
jgi:hypothetical protein